MAENFSIKKRMIPWVPNSLMFIFDKEVGEKLLARIERVEGVNRAFVQDGNLWIARVLGFSWMDIGSKVEAEIQNYFSEVDNH